MDDVAKHLVDILEYLVGGVLFLGSLAFSAHLLYPDQFAAFARDLKQVPDAFTTMIGLAGLALTYAFGVVAEGISRNVAEPRLSYLTANAFADDPDVHPEGPGWRARWEACRQERERQRSYVDNHDPALAARINDQLKRLRVERIFFLASVLCALAAFVATRWQAGLWLTLLAAVAGFLVDTRFHRYLEAITRGHTIVKQPRPAAEPVLGGADT